MTIFDLSNVDVQAYHVPSHTLRRADQLLMQLSRSTLSKRLEWPIGLDIKVCEFFYVLDRKYEIAPQELMCYSLLKSQSLAEYLYNNHAQIIRNSKLSESEIIIKSTKYDAVYKFCNSIDIDNRLHKLDSFLKYTEIKNPIVVSTLCFIDFLLIHPLKDGNGRLARAIFQYVLILKDSMRAPYFPITGVVISNKELFKIAFLKIAKDGCIQAIVELILDIIEINLSACVSVVHQLR